jgi:ubiquinone/menaquinone biosynthesis C-methylase UbiE
MFLKKGYTFVSRIIPMAPEPEKKHVCPWWIGYFLLIPIRRFAQSPRKILTPFVRDGMTVLEVGPGMGFFSLTLARMVGGSGKVICVDVQDKMLEKLKGRAQKAGLDDRITTIQAANNSLRIDAYANGVDFALAFAVVHEVPDEGSLFEQVSRSMKPGALLLFSEPTGHVTEDDFRTSIELACSKGLEEETTLHIMRSHSILLRKKGTANNAV